MNSQWPLLCLLFLLAREGFAQHQPQWPRHPTTGRIAFTGVLPWPTSSLTLNQQQALAQRWYTAKLTQVNPAKQAEWTKEETTFAGLPTLAYMDSVSYSPSISGAVDSVHDRVTWRLLYQVHLAPTPLGLDYQLSNFECVELVSDASTSGTLEAVLTRYAAEQAVFYRRLRRALAGW